MKTFASILITLLLCSPLCALQQLTFQEGINGYASTVDIKVTTGYDGWNERNSPTFSSDINDTIPTHYTLAMLKFDNVIGTGHHQVPVGSTIDSAVLQIDVYNHGSGIFLHRILEPWDDTSTWVSLNNGPDLNSVHDDGWGVQAHIPGPCNIFIAGCPWPYGQAWPFEAGFTYFLDVTPSLVSWVNGGDNQGWALSPPHPNGTNAVGVMTSEAPIVSERPKLTVTYVPIPEPKTFFGAALAFVLLASFTRRFCNANQKDSEEESYEQ